MSTLTFYTNPQSRGRVVRWILEEIGQPYNVKIMNFGIDIKSADYLDINPMGKVPALVHDGSVITEVVAICTYLAEQFPQARLAPALNSAERASYYRWLFFAAGPLEMALTVKANKWEITKDSAVSVGCGQIQDTLNALVQTLTKQDYLCGDQFTTADLVMSSYIGFHIMLNILEPTPVFTQYVERCKSREAAMRAEAMDNALIGQE